MADLWELETEIHKEGYQIFCGVDEAGRGPLAGPVYAAAVILRPGNTIEGLNDSKKLSEKKREELFPIIQRVAEAWCVASASGEEIEKLNILGATILSMNRAIEGLKVRPELALIDGNQCRGIKIPARTIVRGDARCASISAASILAKVSRIWRGWMPFIRSTDLQNIKDMGRNSTMTLCVNSVPALCTGPAF